MRQIVLVESEKFELREIEIPDPGINQVLLEVKAVGICGSDIHTYYGKHPFVNPPIVLGHEATGKIVKLGKDVVDFSIGDHVVVRPQKVCNDCKPCKEGRYNICENLNVLGCLSTGASSDYYAVDTEILYKIPKTISFPLGTLLEPLAVGVHALNRGGGVKNKNILVLGAGTIGNVTAQAAKALGAKSVTITDISSYKLNLAEKCGIDFCVNVNNTDLKQFIDSTYKKNNQIDLIIECSGSELALNQAITVAPKGINIVVASVFESFACIDIASVQDREYSLIGTLMYTHSDYVEAIKIMNNNIDYLNLLLTKVFPFEDCAKAYKYIEKNRDNVQKIVLSLE